MLVLTSPTPSWRMHHPLAGSSNYLIPTFVRAGMSGDVCNVAWVVVQDAGNSEGISFLDKFQDPKLRKPH